jgi:hypothetical protein
VEASDASAAVTTDVPEPPLTERQTMNMESPEEWTHEGSGRREPTQCGRRKPRDGEGQADWSFFAAAATRATNAMSMMRRFMR